MPGDLNLKKSWNPALVKNQKKVWEREQDALKEYQQIKQRRKEIEQEREKEELIRLQYGNDPDNVPTKQKLELNKLGWMYTDVPKKDDEVNESGFREVEEDFLLNKDDVEQLLKGGKVVKKNTTSRFDQVSTVGSKRPAASLIDDPLLMIKREQVKRRTESSRDDKERARDGRHRNDRGLTNRERSPSRRSSDDGDRHRLSKSTHGHSSRSGHSNRSSHSSKSSRSHSGSHSSSHSRSKDHDRNRSSHRSSSSRHKSKDSESSKPETMTT